MEIQHSQLKINHLSDTPSTKAAGGGVFSGVFTQGRQGTTQGQEDFELSWYLFFQQHSYGKSSRYFVKRIASRPWLANSTSELKQNVLVNC
jgi:hypothetical protein